MMKDSRFVARSWYRELAISRFVKACFRVFLLYEFKYFRAFQIIVCDSTTYNTVQKIEIIIHILLDLSVICVSAIIIFKLVLALTACEILAIPDNFGVISSTLLIKLPSSVMITVQWALFPACCFFLFISFVSSFLFFTISFWQSKIIC